MNRQEELAVGRRLLGHIDARTTELAVDMFRNRTINYSCRERAALERQKLFRDGPVFMGLSARLAKPGDFMTEDVAGMPVLLARGAAKVYAVDVGQGQLAFGGAQALVGLGRVGPFVGPLVELRELGVVVADDGDVVDLGEHDGPFGWSFIARSRQ